MYLPFFNYSDVVQGLSGGGVIKVRLREARGDREKGKERSCD